MLELVYNANNNSVYVYNGFRQPPANYIYGFPTDATYAASEDGLTYVISTISGSTLTNVIKLPLAQTVITIVPIEP
jgi:hypothetical protein